MTTTIAYADTTDGALVSNNANYTTARNGSGPATITSDSGNSLIWGQQLDGTPAYNCYEAFLSFTYTVPASETITAAYLRTKAVQATTTSVSRSMVWAEYDWGASVDATDWRNPTQINALTQLATIGNAEDAGTGYFMAGSDALITRLGSASPLRVVGTSDRMRNGTTPTGTEWAWFSSADRTGTSDDPALIFTSIPQSRLFGVLGAQVQLSDGTHAYLESSSVSPNGSSLTLKYHNGTSASTINTLSASFSSSAVIGAQAYTLAVDASDNLYVIGSVSASPGNSLLAQAFAKGVGASWTAKTGLSASLPSYTSGSLNNFAAAWHNVGTSGTIMAVASHTAGQTDNTTGDIVYALLNCQSLLAGSGTLLRGSGAARSTVIDYFTDSGYYTSYANETGSLLDVVAAPGTTDRGYVFSTGPSRVLGLATEAPVTYRYRLASTGISIADSDFTGWTEDHTKDGNAKLRVIGIDGTTFVIVNADAVLGVSVRALQNSGDSATFTNLGVAKLEADGPASMPTAATLSTSSAWDAVHDPTANKLWVYYLDTANSNRLLRTSVDLNTYLAAADEVQVSAAIGAVGSTNYAIRVHRGKTNGQQVLVTVANKTSGGTHSTIYITDTINVAPNAPTLTPKANFDATASSVFSWTFSDPNAGDTQSAYQLQIDNASTGASAVDTGKVTSTTSSHTLGAAALANGVNYRWRVRTYDAGDLVGAYSSYGTFSTSAGGTVTITNPATDNPAGVITSNYNIAWSVSGTTQASYRVVVIRTDTSAQLLDTGDVTSTATTYNVTGMLSDVQYQISVTVKNASAVQSSAGTRLITPSYANPEKPTFSTSVTADHILISVTNPTPTGSKPEVTKNQILRRINGSSDPYTLVGTTTVNGTFKDYTAASNVTYQYIVRGVA